MRVVERVAIRPPGCALAEAVLLEVLYHNRVGQLVITFERQQVIAATCQDLLGNRGLAPLASGTARVRPSRVMTEPINLSVWRSARRNTARSVSAVAMAKPE